MESSRGAVRPQFSALAASSFLEALRTHPKASPGYKWRHSPHACLRAAG
jgi:hypothetical protein